MNIATKDAVIWVNRDTKEVKITTNYVPRPPGAWCDHIGAAYASWKHEMTDDERARVMTETALDLAMAGFSLPNVLRTFAEVPAFRALADQSYPMCRALTTALVGKCLEPNTMTFEELIAHEERLSRNSKQEAAPAE